MANIKISDLPERTTFDDNCAVPIDDSIQSWKVRAQQLRPGLRVRKPVRQRLRGSGNFTVPSAVSQILVNVANPPDQFATAGAGGGAIDILTGIAWVWGTNPTGNLGNGNIAPQSSPVQVIGGMKFTSISMGDVDSGDSCVTMFKTADGKLYAAGKNHGGQLGDGTITRRSSPVAVIGGHTFSKVVSGYYTTTALKADGSIWCWGVNSAGQVGDGTIVDRSSPVAVIGGHSFVDISVSTGLKADGSVWCWGDNLSGELGQSSIVPRSSPVQVIGGHSFVKVVASTDGYRRFGLKSTGTAWSWGGNFYGQLGTGDAEFRSSPVQVIGGHSFIDISVGTLSAAGVKANGSGWAWGHNDAGNVGDGTTVHRSSPVAVIGGHSFISVSAGFTTHQFAKENGSLWCVGLGVCTGDGTDAPRSSPVQVIGATKFGQVNSNQRFYSLWVTPGDVIAYTPSAFGSVSFPQSAEVWLEFMGLDS